MASNTFVVIEPSWYSPINYAGLEKIKIETHTMANAEIANHLPRSSPVVGHKSNPLFNVLAGIVIAIGIIYAGYHLADDLSVVRDTRIYPYVLLGVALCDMYLVSEGLRFLGKSKSVSVSADDKNVLGGYKKQLDNATKFIPPWVKVAVAIALGLGTMIGWKRIVVTVGERIGKTHLTYAQGASAEFVAMATIGAAELYGLPVSTTHVLSSGVAGTMAANGSGLQMATIRNMVMAW